MLTKSKIKMAIDELPDSFSLEEIVEKLIVLDKVEKGYSQSEKGEVVSEAAVEEEMAKWFK